jgi:hypothetical protein
VIQGVAREDGKIEELERVPNRYLLLKTSLSYLDINKTMIYFIILQHRAHYYFFEMH